LDGSWSASRDFMDCLFCPIFVRGDAPKFCAAALDPTASSVILTE
jgi:hypothetical protein